MADRDIDRAEGLLRSARTLLNSGDVAGVCGLAYQAFEAAVDALNKHLAGSVAANHTARRQIATTLLHGRQADIEFLWDARNVDFYGNTMPGAPPQTLAAADVERALRTVAAILDDIRVMIADGADS